jgi:hypothetical protein
MGRTLGESIKAMSMGNFKILEVLMKEPLIGG